MTTPAVFTRPMSAELARLRAAMLASGWAAESPDTEGERMAREDRRTER